MADRLGSKKSNPQQSVLNFGGESPPLLSSDFALVLNEQLFFAHKGGVRAISDGKGGKKGFLIEYKDPTCNKIVPGITTTIKQRFGNPDMNIVLTESKRGSTSSIQLGNLIHRHIFHLVECARLPANDRCSCSPNPHNNINKFARTAMNFFKRKGWTPLRSELGIYSPRMNVATRVDVLCINTKFEFVLISIKTGYTGIDKEKPINTNWRFKPPLNMLEDTAGRRHQLQLLMEKIILEEEYGVTISECGVLYVNSIANKPDEVIFRTPHSSHISSEAIDALYNYYRSNCDEKIGGDSVTRSVYWPPPLALSASQSNSLSENNSNQISEYSLDMMLTHG